LLVAFPKLAYSRGRQTICYLGLRNPFKKSVDKIVFSKHSFFVYLFEEKRDDEFQDSW
jgi:hypothetical protein